MVTGTHLSPSSPRSTKHVPLSPIITTIPASVRSPTPSIFSTQEQPSTNTSKSKATPLRIATLALAVTSTALSIAILGTTAHTYHVYHAQMAANNPWWLPLWPGHFSTTGTRAVIGASAGVALVNLLVIAGALGLKVGLATRPMVKALTGFLVPVVSILLALFSIILTHLLNNRSSGSDTIQTWTCKFSTALPSTPMLQGGRKREMSNDKFGLLCSESRFGFWGMVAVVILQVLMGLAAVGEWIVSRKGGMIEEREEKGMEMGIMEADKKTEFSY